MTDAATIKQWAILNSGATSHFLTTNAPTTNIIPAAVPLIACLPKVTRCNQRTPAPSTCPLSLLAPEQPTSFPATFTKINCTIAYRGRTNICGHKCTRTGL